MENLTQDQIETTLAKVAELLNYLNDEFIVLEFDNSLIDSLIRCYESLKLKTGEPENKRTERLEKYAKWYIESIQNELKS